MSLIVWIAIVVWLALLVAVVVLSLAARRLDDEIAEEETRESHLAGGHEPSTSLEHPPGDPGASRSGSSSTQGRNDRA
jgi:heme exporter protein D